MPARSGFSSLGTQILDRQEETVVKYRASPLLCDQLGLVRCKCDAAYLETDEFFAKSMRLLQFIWTAPVVMVLVEVPAAKPVNIRCKVIQTVSCTRFAYVTSL